MNRSKIVGEPVMEVVPDQGTAARKEEASLPPEELCEHVALQRGRIEPRLEGVHLPASPRSAIPRSGGADPGGGRSFGSACATCSGDTNCHTSMSRASRSILPSRRNRSGSGPCA